MKRTEATAYLGAGEGETCTRRPTGADSHEWPFSRGDPLWVLTTHEKPIPERECAPLSSRSQKHLEQFCSRGFAEIP